LINVLSTLSVTKKSYVVCPWLIDYIIRTCYKDLTVIEKLKKIDKIINKLRYFKQERQLTIACSTYRLEKKLAKNYIDSKTNLKDLDSKIKNLVQEFISIKNNEIRLQFIVKLEKENLTEEELISFFNHIPDKYGDYYNFLSFSGISACKYQEASIKRKIESIYINSDIEDKIKDEIYRLFTVGYRYSKSDIKSTLKNAYERIGYQKTAKASDLEEYFIVKDTKLQDDTKKWVNGFEILSKK
jgi:hypothetical protein